MKKSLKSDGIICTQGDSYSHCILILISVTPEKANQSIFT